jgi:uncharacterized protein (TIRG00374 family)
MRERAVQSLTRGNLGRFFRILAIAVALGVAGNLALAVATTDRGALSALTHVSPGFLVLGVLITLVPWLTNSLRTLTWVRFMGVPIDLREAWRIVLATELGSAVTPTAGGGGYVKAAMLIEHGMPAGRAASLMVIGTIENALFFAAALPLALTWIHGWDLPILRDSVAAIVAHGPTITLAAALVALAGVIGRRPLSRIGSDPDAAPAALRPLARLLRGAGRIGREFVGSYALIARRGKGRLATNLALATVGWVARYSVVSCLFAGLGAAVQPLKFAILQWMVFTFVTFVPTPGGAGAAEAGFYLAYRGLVPEELLGLGTAAWRFLTFYLLLSVGGIAFAVLTGIRARHPGPAGSGWRGLRAYSERLSPTS